MQVLRSLSMSFGKAQPYAHQACPVKGWEDDTSRNHELLCAALVLLVCFCVYVALADLELII